MRKLALATAATALLLGLGAVPASAHDTRGWNSRDHHHRTERPGDVRRHQPASEIVRVGVHRRYFDEAIPLRRLLGLGPDYRGYRVQSVTVKMRPRPTRARLDLLADGAVVDRARARHTRYVELRPDDDRTLGRDLGRLQLGVRGRAFIDSIQVKLRPPRHRHHGGPVVHRGHKHKHERPDADVAEQVVRIILGQIDLADGGQSARR